MPDGLPDGDEEPGPQCDGRFAERQTVENLMECGRGDQIHDIGRGGETDHRVFADRLPVACHEQRDGRAGLTVRPAPESGGEAFVGFLGNPAGRGVRRTRGVGVGTERIPSHAQDTEVLIAEKER